MTNNISQTSFASSADLVATWKDLTTDELSRADVLLLQASNYLRQIGRNNGKNIDDLVNADASGVYGANVKTIVCACVQRAMAAPTDIMPDASQFSQSASPYSESMSFSGNTSASIYFKEKELKLLGLSTVDGKKGIGLLRGVR